MKYPNVSQAINPVINSKKLNAPGNFACNEADSERSSAIIFRLLRSAISVPSSRSITFIAFSLLKLFPYFDIIIESTTATPAVY